MTEMNQSIIAGLLQRLSNVGKLRNKALNLSVRMEGGECYSLTARWILKKHFGVTIGDYSYGDCFAPGSFPPGVTIGRYASIGPGVRAFLRNHPFDRLSMHPIFYNKRLGYLKEDTIDASTLEVGHDAWVGAGTLILRGCTRIGIGAVIGAGSVVTKDVPDFAIAVGNPARVIRMRFPEEQCQRIRDSRWWELSAKETAQYMPQMIAPLSENYPAHPLLTRQNIKTGTP